MTREERTKLFEDAIYSIMKNAHLDILMVFEVAEHIMNKEELSEFRNNIDNILIDGLFIDDTSQEFEAMKELGAVDRIVEGVISENSNLIIED
jgi:hypothetical protein